MERSRRLSRTVVGWLGAVALASTGLVLGFPSPSLALPPWAAPAVPSPEIRVPLPAVLRIPMPAPKAWVLGGDYSR
ncbi:MAG: hypothetical protein ACRD0C_19595 [Acidimicrobiia bacterium]